MTREIWLLSKAFRRPCWKNCISSYVWHKSFIQAVKCSFFNQWNVYQSFCGALLTLSYVYFKEKFCVKIRHASESHLWDCRKNYISGSVWHKSFIQMVKYSFPDKFFYGAPLTFSYFYLSSRKVVCFGTHFKVACLDRVSLWRKNILVVFAPWRGIVEACIPSSIWQKSVNSCFNGKIMLTIFSQL